MNPGPTITRQRTAALARVLARRLAAGDPLPTCRTIARGLGVSHTAAQGHIRRAMTIAGLVVVRQPGRWHPAVVLEARGDVGQ